MGEKHPATGAKRQESSRPRRILRRLLVGLVGLFVLAMVLLALLPSILSTEAGRTRVAGWLGEAVGAPVELSELSLSWTGRQRVAGLRVGQPPGIEVEGDLLVVREATLETGLLALVFPGDDAVRLTAREPLLRIHRGRDGRFNYEELKLWKERDAGGEGEEGDTEHGEHRGLRLPDGVDRIELSLEGGELLFDDEKLGTSSSVNALEVRGLLSPDRGSFELLAGVGHPEARPETRGRIEVDAEVHGLGAGQRFSTRARGTIDRLDLRPYRSLLRELAGATPPEEPVSGRFSLETAKESVTGSLELDAGFVRVATADLELPRTATGKSGFVRVPFSLDLAGLAAAAGRPIGLSDDASIGGRVDGSLELRGPLSSRALVAGALPDEIAFALEVEGNEVSWVPASPPATAGKPAPGTAPRSPLRSEADDGPVRPAAFRDESFRLSLQGRAEEGFGRFVFETARLVAPDVDVDLTGAVTRRAVARAGSGHVRGAPATSGGLGLDLRLEASVGGERVVEHLLPSHARDVRVERATRFEVPSLEVRGVLGGAGGFLETLEAEGPLSLRGELAWSGFRVSRFEGKATVARGGLALTDIEASVNDGRLSGSKLEIGLGSGERSFALELDAKGVQANYELTPLLAYVLPFLSLEERRAELSGAIVARLALEGRGLDLADLRRSLEGSGSLRIGSGTLSASRFFRELGETLGTSFDRVLFSEMGSDFQVGEGRVVCRDVFLQLREGGKIRKLGLEGVTRLDGSIEYGVRTSVLRESIGDDKIRRILEVVGRVFGDESLPLRLRGTLSSPRLAFDLTSVPPPRLDRLFDGLPGLDEIPGIGGPRREKPNGENRKDEP